MNFWPNCATRAYEGETKGIPETGGHAALASCQRGCAGSGLGPDGQFHVRRISARAHTVTEWTESAWARPSAVLEQRDSRKSAKLFRANWRLVPQRVAGHADEAPRGGGVENNFDQQNWVASGHNMHNHQFQENFDNDEALAG